MERRRVLELGGAALLGATAGCLTSGSSDRRHVAMTDDLVYDPERLRVDAGTTVVWTNEGDVGHTVTAFEDEIPADASYFDSGGFDSERAARRSFSEGLLAAGETFEHTFEVSGTYRYYCVPHEGSGMVGSVVVR